MPESLNDYSEVLNSALAESKPYINFNRDSGHATIVVGAIFEHAKEHVRVLSNHLDPVVYANPFVEERMLAFLDGGGKLDVLVESDIDMDHAIYRMAERFADQISVRRVPDQLQGTYPFNFIVMDDAGYRFERDRGSPQALVAFHDGGESYPTSTITKALIDRFDGLMHSIA